MSYRKWILIAAGLFIFGIILGLVVPSAGAGLLFSEAAALEEMAGILDQFPQIILFLFIFLKNISVIVFSFVLSPLFCFVPFITLVINGGVIGVVSAIVIREISLPFLLAGLLPHGILEIPALIMGEAVALSFGVVAIQGILSKNKRDVIIPNLRNNLKYLAVSTGLFLAAAVIETWVTPLLLDRVS